MLIKFFYSKIKNNVSVVFVPPFCVHLALSNLNYLQFIINLNFNEYSYSFMCVEFNNNNK